MSSSNNTLLVGGAGYVGTQLASELVKRGRSVTVLGRKPIPEYALPPEVTYLTGDFADGYLLGSLLDAHDEVVHLASASTPSASSADAIGELVQNVTPALRLFAGCASRGIRLLLVSSGGAVYGHADQLPISETQLTRPISNYGVAKLVLETYANLYAATQGLKYICVRPANAYGDGQRAFTGQGFVSTAVASCLKGLPVKIFGQHGTVRDYVYIGDLARGIAEALDRGLLGETYNIGSGVGFSNRDITDMLAPLLRDLGVDLVVEHLPSRPFDVKSNILTSEKLKSATGWQPTVGIEEGLRQTVLWWKKLYG